MIDAKTKVFGLLANPIGHSLSPRFQNALAAYCGENAVYLPFEVKRPETLEAALKGTVLFDILAVFIQGGSTDSPQLTPCQCRL